MSRRCEVVTTYEELRFYRNMFLSTEDGIELVIVGRPGLGKTRAFAGTLGQPGKDYVLIRGNQTAFEMYRTLYAGCDLPVLLDDVDDAFIDPKKKTLLKEALETEEIKSVSWGSSTDKLVDAEGKPIPRRFDTKSRFCVIANKLTNRTEEHISALLSRAFCIEFQPSIIEIHKYVAEWFTDEEIYEYVGQNLNLIVELDIRDYGHALKLKRHGGNWRAMLMKRWLADDRHLPVLRIMTDPTLTNTTRRAGRFKELTGGSRATYMRLQAEIRRLRGGGQYGACVRRETEDLLLGLPAPPPAPSENDPKV